MRSVSDQATAVYNSHIRQYRYAVYLIDVLGTGAPSWADIVASTTTALSGFQLDVTSHVADGLSINEPGDGRASQLGMTLVSRDDLFAPWGTYARYVQRGCVVRVREGDAGLDENQWTWTFSGHVRGQAGYSVDRDGLTKETEIRAYGRRATPKYLKQQFISKSYGRRVDYGQILSDIARNEMGLATSELSRLDTVLGRVTQFAANTIAEMTPLEASEKLLETVGKHMDFDGEGLLRLYSYDLTRAEDLRLTDLRTVQGIRIPSADTETYNAIGVKGLDKNLTEVKEPDQLLARASLTVGFWRPRHTEKVEWSEDRATRAENTRMKVLTSVTESLILGFGTEAYDEADAYSGTIRIDITGYLATLIALIAVTLLAQAVIPDEVIPGIPVVTDPATGVGSTIGTGQTFSVGRLAQALTMMLITTTLSTISSGQYEIYGTVLVPVYKQLSTNAVEANTPAYLVHQRDIENDWINELDHAHEVAVRELIFEAAQRAPRELTLLNDPRLELGDIVLVPFAGGLRVWVESLRKTISRGQVPLLQIQGVRAL
jgi:hypothetical protein